MIEQQTVAVRDLRHDQTADSRTTRLRTEKIAALKMNVWELGLSETALVSGGLHLPLPVQAAGLLEPAVSRPLVIGCCSDGD
jgi:hypothetical protein